MTAMAPNTGARGSRTGVAIATAVTILVGVTLVILLVGYVPVPDLPSLVDAPDPSIAGEVAYATDGDDGCVSIVAASGAEARELACLGHWIEGIAWTTGGTIAAMSYDEIGPQIDVIDPDSGAIVETLGYTNDLEVPERVMHSEPTRADGTRVALRDEYRSGEDGTTTLTVVAPDGTRTVIAELTGPRDYAFRTAVWSPDGHWVLASDSRGRLIVVAEDGEPGPRLLAETGDGQRWDTAMAWHVAGSDVGTIDLDDVRGPTG